MWRTQRFIGGRLLPVLRFGQALLLPALVATLALASVAPALATTVVVDSLGDEKVADGTCTLREAIWTTNVNYQVAEPEAGDCEAGEDGPVRDVIQFAISGAGPHTIEVGAEDLGYITDPLEIDGSEGEANQVNIQLDGSSVTTGDGLFVSGSGSGSYIHNVAVYEFPDDGIVLYGDENEVERVISGMGAGGAADKGNGGDGIEIAGERNTVRYSAVSGNVGDGIRIDPAFGVNGAENTVKGTRIGTNKTGTAAIPNEGDGVHLALSTVEGQGDGDDLTIGGSEGVTPGGPCTGDCNVISGNAANGIVARVTASGEERTTGLSIQGNHIGTNAAGTAAIANEGEAGVKLWGGTAGASISGNVISGNVNRGVFILAGGPSDTGAADTSITGNTIGLGSDGETTIANGTHGIFLDRSLLNGPELPGTTIGGTADPSPGGICDGDCNLISGNGQSGIVLAETFTEGGPISETTIVGNYIGTDRGGSEDRGNGTWGIQLSAVSDVTAGQPGSPNVISGNGSSGIYLGSAGATGNTVQANLIGVAADGATPLGNDGHGVDVGSGGNLLNTIGGIGVGLGNEIAYNGKTGVMVAGGENPAVDNPILGNSIHDNAELGIDLRVEPLEAGVTENGACEEATGANRCQEFPVLTAAAGEGTSAALAGTLDSDPGKTFRIELFASAAADPSGNGEGERFLGAVDATTDGAGKASWSFVSTTAPLAAGEHASATATELDGSSEPLSTSEFSDAVEAPTCDLEGEEGVDELAGGAGDEVICGHGEGDTLSGGAGSDAVFGGEGDDTIMVADGEADALVDCGPGTDTVEADAEATDPAAIFVGCETVNRPAPEEEGEGEEPEGEGEETPPGQEVTPVVSAPPASEPATLLPTPTPIASTKVYKCKGKRATIVGTGKKETIKGTRKADVIVALGGNDVIKGFGGNDTICGGNGKDTIKGGPGNDVLRGEGGNDRLFGENGYDRLDGGKGKDVLKGGSQNDRLRGSAGNGDLCDGQSGKKDKLDGRKHGCEKRKRIP